MQPTRRLSKASKLTCLLLLVLLVGCATQTAVKPVDVGAVVVAPRVTLPPLPQVVQETEPKPAGFFQRSLLDYSTGLPSKPTPSTPPTLPAGKTPSP